MLSAKQWGFVLKGSKKTARGLKAAAKAGGKAFLTGGKAPLETKDGAKVIRMGKNLKGGFSQSTKRGAAIADATGKAYRTWSKGFKTVADDLKRNPKRARAIVLGAAGAAIGGEAGGLEAKAKGKSPAKQKLAIGTGALGGAIGGFQISNRGGKLYKIGKSIVSGKVSRKHAIGVTVTAGLLGASGASYEKTKIEARQKKLGYEHKPSKIIGTVKGGVKSAATGAGIYAGVVQGYHFATAGRAASEKRPPQPSKFKAAAKGAKAAYSKFQSRAFPKKPKALVGMYGGE